MKKVRCFECGKTYNYDEDAFCPKCGAFNQPPKSAHINEVGEVVRVDGINEQGHAESFVHAELHRENRERRKVGLDKDLKKKASMPSPRAAAPRVSGAGERGGERKPTGNPVVNVIRWVILIIVFSNLIRACAFIGF